jgi:pyruvate dehydrogenase E1 component alpha subunit
VPINIVVGSQTQQATGIGYALKYRGEKAAAVCLFGDGATSQGDFHEALNFASVWQAPVVFVCQNNQWAISVPRSKQTHSRTLAQKAIAYDMPGIQVDGNDILSVYAATKEALQRAYEGQGPTLIEAMTYRLMMHTTADDPTKYRSEEEAQSWWAKEPLIRFRKVLENKGIWDEAKDADLRQQVENEVKAAVDEFESRRDFKPDAPFDHVFGTRHAVIDQQREEFLAQLRKEAGDA